jgi:ABC-type transport system involved in multi-copper enzyme maturation permease subunit
VFQLEWQANARKPRFLWLRALYAGGVLVALAHVLAPELAQSGGGLALPSVARLGESFFWALSLVQLLAVLLLTPAITAGTIAEEAQGRRLESLLTTDLTVAEIVLGKLSARLLLQANVLAAGLPVLALCIWLGGVTGETLLAVVTLTTVVLGSTGALSIWVSAHARCGREALQVVYVTGMILGVFPPLFVLTPLPWPGGLVGAALRWADQALIAPNPAFWMVRWRQAGAIDWQQWGLVVLVHLALGLVLTLLAIVQLPSAVRRYEPSPARRWRLLPVRWPHPGQWPMLWKEHFPARPAAGLGRLVHALILLIGWGVLGWMLWALAVSLTDPAVGPRTPFRVFATLVEPPLVCIALLGVMVRAATAVSGERERGTWDSVLTTPLTPAAIVGGKLIGSLLASRWIWLLLALLCTLGVATGQLRPRGLLLTVLSATAIALCAATLGLLLSLRCKTSLRALIAALGISLSLSGGYLLLCLPLLLARGSEPRAWLIAPCVPAQFVLAVVLAAADPPNGSVLESTCCLGAGIYAIVWTGLLAIVWWRFDRLAGRSTLPR